MLTVAGKKMYLKWAVVMVFIQELLAVEKLSITDHDPLFIEDISKRNPRKWQLDAFVHDVLNGPSNQI